VKKSPRSRISKVRKVEKITFVIKGPYNEGIVRYREEKGKNQKGMNGDRNKGGNFLRDEYLDG